MEHAHKASAAAVMCGVASETGVWAHSTWAACARAHNSGCWCPEQAAVQVAVQRQSMAGRSQMWHCRHQCKGNSFAGCMFGRMSESSKAANCKFGGGLNV
jgi:hypothetical protein